MWSHSKNEHTLQSLLICLFLIIIFIIEAFLLCGVYIYIVCVCVCLLVGGVGHGCKLISW